MRDDKFQNWIVFLNIFTAIGSGFLYFAAIWVVYELGMAFINKL